MKTVLGFLDRQIRNRPEKPMFKDERETLTFAETHARAEPFRRVRAVCDFGGQIVFDLRLVGKAHELERGGKLHALDAPNSQNPAISVRFVVFPNPRH